MKCDCNAVLGVLECSLWSCIRGEMVLGCCQAGEAPTQSLPRPKPANSLKCEGQDGKSCQTERSPDITGSNPTRVEIFMVKNILL